MWWCLTIGREDKVMKALGKKPALCGGALQWAGCAWQLLALRLHSVGEGVGYQLFVLQRDKQSPQAALRVG